MGVQHLSPSATMLLSNPRVRSLVYWDNPRDSGIVCGSLLVCLLAVRYISLISVIGNLSLALVTATMSFRIYKSVLAAVNKNQEGHPFKAFLDVDIRIPEAQLTAAVENAGARINGLLAALKAAILVENLVESAKFAVGMYLVSYLGKLMTGLTLVTLVWAGIFSLPRSPARRRSRASPPSTSSTLPSRKTPAITVEHHLHDVVSLFLPATDKETFAADILTSLTTFSFFLPSTSARGPI